MDVRNAACEALLAQRVEQKLKGSRINSVANKIHVAMPVKRDDVERKPFIPEAALNRVKYDKNDPERRTLERDLEQAMDGVDIFSADTRSEQPNSMCADGRKLYPRRRLVEIRQDARILQGQKRRRFHRSRYRGKAGGFGARGRSIGGPRLLRFGSRRYGERHQNSQADFRSTRKKKNSSRRPTRFKRKRHPSSESRRKRTDCKTNPSSPERKSTSRCPSLPTECANTATTRLFSKSEQRDSSRRKRLHGKRLNPRLAWRWMSTWTRSPIQVSRAEPMLEPPEPTDSSRVWLPKPNPTRPTRYETLRKESPTDWPRLPNRIDMFPSRDRNGCWQERERVERPTDVRRFDVRIRSCFFSLYTLDDFADPALYACTIFRTL